MAATDEFLAALGEQLRARRHEAALTVQQLADRSGISRRMLTQIELGQANPSLVTVDKVARALGTDFASLARGRQAAPLVVNRPGATPGVWSSPAGSHAELAVATTQQPAAELWEWTLEPGDRYDAEPDPAGSEELFLVLAGTLTISAAGLEPVALPAGSSARLASDRRYAYENRTRRRARFVRVVQIAP
jgi:transcriptional regulator with XRE-family HTH domain